MATDERAHRQLANRRHLVCRSQHGMGCQQQRTDHQDCRRRRVWTEQLHDPEVYWRCVGFASATRGWAGTLTSHKTLFETRDGGTTWQAVTNLPPNPPSAICGMSVVSEQVVYLSGTNFPNRPPRMMKTTDGGASWTAIDMRPWASILIDTFFTSPTRGWVVGGKTDEAVATRANVKPVVLLTEDGGQTWVNRVAGLSQQFPKGEWGWKIQFLNDQVGFVSLENFSTGAILKTSDGGATWTRLAINDPQANANLEGVGFIDETHGWVGGWGDAQFLRLSTSQTTDGGQTWSNANEVGKATQSLSVLRSSGDGWLCVGPNGLQVFIGADALPTTMPWRRPDRCSLEGPTAPGG